MSGGSKSPVLIFRAPGMSPLTALSAVSLLPLSSSPVFCCHVTLEHLLFIVDVVSDWVWSVLASASGPASLKWSDWSAMWNPTGFPPSTAADVQGSPSELQDPARTSLSVIMSLQTHPETLGLLLESGECVRADCSQTSTAGLQVEIPLHRPQRPCARFQ